jgi:hypothetical protein
MSSTAFETEGSSSGRRLYVQLWYMYSCGIMSFTRISLNTLMGRRLFSMLFSGPRVETVISKVERNAKILNAQ